MRSRKKILAISSSGGRWTQMLRLRPAFEGYDVIYATTDAGSRADVPDKRFYTVPNAARWNKSKLILLFTCVVAIVIKERPDVVISTGAAPGFFGILVGQLTGAKTIWLESIANAEKLSLSTKLARHFADLWLTQWSHMAGSKGPIYKGSVF
jgi:UDP-N-acetylglucosamine:LPS N-acetylglucosamine transferase